MMLSPEEKHRKIVTRMEKIDALPKEVRELIHEFGFTVVTAFLDQKIVKANIIRHLIEQVQRGSVDVGTGIGGVGATQNGRNMVVIPKEPTPDMIHASMATVSNHDMVVDKYEKHKLRLRAAINVGIARHI